MDRFVKFCKCGCNNGVILKFDKTEEELFMSLVSDNFYTYQRNNLLRKLKAIWSILRGKEYCYFEILMDKDEIKEFKGFVEKI